MLMLVGLRDCFLPSLRYKCRRSIETHFGTRKRSALKASGNLLLGFSGGLGSTVLLHLISETYFAPERVPQSTGGASVPLKKGNVWNKGIVCYVEVCGAFPGVRLSSL
jgi:cytoplasmic tRNA 2-thiolation protein 2